MSDFQYNTIEVVFKSKYETNLTFCYHNEIYSHALYIGGNE